MHKAALFLGSINAMLAVILGAFGSHGLKSRLTEEMLTVYQTGVQYHFYHSLGLILAGIIAIHLPGSPLVKWSIWFMAGGIVLFSGSLYILAITNTRWLGMVTPVGGTAFILSWLLLAIAVVKIK